MSEKSEALKLGAETLLAEAEKEEAPPTTYSDKAIALWKKLTEAGLPEELVKELVLTFARSYYG